MREWKFVATQEDRGVLTASMYEITHGIPTNERQSIRVELELEEVISLQESINRVLAYHLRIMR
jgi:hypothetical protein